MTIAHALKVAAKKAGWSATKIAATVGKSEASARQWLKGATDMSATDYQRLREELPGFAELIDHKAVAA